MKVVAFRAPGKLELDEAAEPSPGPGEAVVAVAYCGICGSDVHEYVAPEPSPRTQGLFQPVMGHELTGVVAAVGQGVAGLAAGDPIVVHPGQVCGDCAYCRFGETNRCVRPLGGIGYSKPGGYGQYVTIHPTQAVPLADRSFLKPAALSEPLGVAMHALNRGGLSAGEPVLITGAGPIGLLTLLAARHKGAGKIIVSEPAARRRELAGDLGADVLIDPKAEEAPPRVQRETEGLGVALAVECVGRPRAMDDAISSLRRGGRVVVAGTFDRPYPVDLVQTLLREHTIVGSLGSVTELNEATGLICAGAIDVSRVISSVISLDEVPAVFSELVDDRGSHCKVLVAPNGSEPP